MCPYCVHGQQISCSRPISQCAAGVVVSCTPPMRATRVRFPGGAILPLLVRQSSSPAIVFVQMHSPATVFAQMYSQTQFSSKLRNFGSEARGSNWMYSCSNVSVSPHIQLYSCKNSFQGSIRIFDQFVLGPKSLHFLTTLWFQWSVIWRSGTTVTRCMSWPLPVTVNWWFTSGQWSIRLRRVSGIYVCSVVYCIHVIEIMIKIQVWETSSTGWYYRYVNGLSVRSLDPHSIPV